MNRNLGRLIKGSNQKGISLVEITVAMAIMGIMTFAIIDLMSTMKAMTLDMNAKIGMTELRGEILQITNNPALCVSRMVNNPLTSIVFSFPGPGPTPPGAPGIVPFPLNFTAPIVFGDGGNLAAYDLLGVNLELANITAAPIYQGVVPLPGFSSGRNLCTTPPCISCYCIGVCAAFPPFGPLGCALQANLNLRASKRPGAAGGAVLQTRTIGTIILEVNSVAGSSQVTNCWTSGAAPMPTCTANQIQISNGTGFTCQTIPTCTPESPRLSFNGATLRCVP